MDYPRKIHKGVSIAIVLLSALVVGCAKKQVEAPLPFDPPEAFSYSGSAEFSDQWWQSFEDQRLNEMIDLALDSNLNLKTAWKRFEAAQAVVDRESSRMFPGLEGSVQSGISQPQPDFVGGELTQFTLYSSYEVDLWGRIRSSIDAKEKRAEASYFDYKAASISLSAEIAQTWFQLLAAQNQLNLTIQQVENNKAILQLLKASYGSGQIRSVDILRQKQLISATQQQQKQFEARVGTLSNSLDLLLGRPPQPDSKTIEQQLPELPALPETGIPTELLSRRPDVQQAYFILWAADREVATAKSSRYPRLTLNTNISVRANNIGDLFENWAYRLGGNLVAPILYWGRLYAEVDRTKAVKDQQLYTYAQTVLTAFQEVENALIRENKQAEGIASLEEQVGFARQSYQQLRIEYFNGMSDYLDVLTALNQQQQLERDLIDAQLSLLQFRIALYRSLAGGFATNRETG